MKNNRIKLGLQFFADGEATGGAPAENTPAANEPAEPPTKPAFDDMLKDKDYQSEFDKRISKALETARAKWDAETQEKLSEAEKLAKMNSEQKHQYEREQAEKKLTEREAAITKRELAATARETLAEKGLPTELAEVLDYSSAEQCKVSIEAVSKAFSAAVEKAVNDRLKGAPPKMGAGNQTDSMEKFRRAAGLK